MFLSSKHQFCTNPQTKFQKNMNKKQNKILKTSHEKNIEIN